jgi:DNA-binding transcriptional regulator YiaG
VRIVLVMSTHQGDYRRDLTNARARLAEAMSSAADVAAAAHAEGMTEVDLAQYLGVNRMTIRKWLGK